MSGWNRERIVFALSILVLLASVIHATKSFVGGEGETIVLVEPTPATEIAVGGAVVIDWSEGGSGEARDPFQAKSEWRPAKPDPLEVPTFESLHRRIPLPAPVADAPRAWPGIQVVPPVDPEEDSP